VKVLYWISGVLVVVNLAASGFFYALFLGSGEPVPKARAVMFWRWAVLVVLTLLNIIIFRRVYNAVLDLFAR
jgi:hypothetical protein